MERIMPVEDWVRRARPLLDRYMDADTISVSIDAGFFLRYAMWTDPRGKQTDPRLRLAGVKAPERYAEGGPEATEYTRNWLLEAMNHSAEWPLVIQTELLDSFGRYIAWVWRVSDGRCLNDDLVEAGHAKRSTA